MGVNLEMYRARIGLFNRHRYKVHVVSSVFNSILVTSIVLSVMTLVMYLILLCGDVELNPGPQSTCLSLWHCNIRGLKGVVNCQNSRDKGPPEGNSARG